MPGSPHIMQERPLSSMRSCVLVENVIGAAGVVEVEFDGWVVAPPRLAFASLACASSSSSNSLSVFVLETRSSSRGRSSSSIFPTADARSLVGTSLWTISGSVVDWDDCAGFCSPVLVAFDFSLVDVDERVVLGPYSQEPPGNLWWAAKEGIPRGREDLSGQSGDERHVVFYRSISIVMKSWASGNERECVDQNMSLISYGCGEMGLPPLISSVTSSTILVQWANWRRSGEK